MLVSLDPSGRAFGSTPRFPAGVALSERPGSRMLAGNNPACRTSYRYCATYCTKTMLGKHTGTPTGIASLLSFLGGRTELSRDDLLLPPPKKTGLYVDIENLRSAEHARTTIEAVLRDWPESLPPVGHLSLYAPADKTGLWKAWASAERFEGIEVRVRGTQRFARESKNSADMAIVADAVADFTAGVANHVAVVSNDSDFGTLFLKIQELASSTDISDQPPFLWINFTGGSGLSKEVRDFVPKQLRWDVAPPTHANAEETPKTAEDDGASLPVNSMIVRWLLKEIPPGRFRAEDVRKIIKRHCPHHPSAQTTAVCGSFLARDLMSLLASKGVTVVRQSPRTYEIPK